MVLSNILLITQKNKVQIPAVKQHLRDNKDVFCIQLF